MTELEAAWQDYLKALNACCNCVNLAALNTRICAEYVEDVAALVRETATLASGMEDIVSSGKVS